MRLAETFDGVFQGQIRDSDFFLGGTSEIQRRSTEWCYYCRWCDCCYCSYAPGTLSSPVILDAACAPELLLLLPSALRMARKKNKQRKEAPDGGNGGPSGGVVAPLGPGLDGPGPASKKDVVTTTATTTNTNNTSASTGSNSKSRAVAPALPQPPASPALIICRNKSVMPSCCSLSHLQVALDTSHRARGVRDGLKAPFSLRGAPLTAPPLAMRQVQLLIN